MTPRERRDLPWILAAFAVLIVVMNGGAIFRWALRPGRRRLPAQSAQSNLLLQPNERSDISSPQDLTRGG